MASTWSTTVWRGSQSMPPKLTYRLDGRSWGAETLELFGGSPDTVPPPPAPLNP